MPFSRTLASTLSFDHAVDLSSLPVRRHLPSHPFVERLRAAVPFDFFAVSGLDLDGYRFGSGHSIDTNVPPAYLDAYYGDGLLASDPFVKASSTATGVVIEQEIYKQDPPSERLLYLAHTFGVLNRTLFPIRRLSRIFGAVTFPARRLLIEKRSIFWEIFRAPCIRSSQSPSWSVSQRRKCVLQMASSTA